MKIDHRECKSTRRGIEYAGTVSQTAEGKPCLKWNTYLKSTTFKFQFPDKNITLAKNYCRNVKLDRRNDPIGPWCISKFPWGFSYSYCDIPYCTMAVNAEECKTTPDGFEYAGTMSQTIRGYKCQPWISQIPHKHTVGVEDYEFIENSVSEAKNYCRNPIDYSRGPWCYTMNPDKEWDNCMIPLCSEPSRGSHPERKYTRQGTEYRGKIAKTGNGKDCFPWVFVSF